MFYDPKTLIGRSISLGLVGAFSFFLSLFSDASFQVDLVADAWGQVETQDIEEANSPKNWLDGKKTGGIVGDPSHKRGFDLGYDAGPRAGREDQGGIPPSNYSQRPEYQNPEQFYRYEYGARAMFIAGYRRGFVRGYKSSMLSQPRTDSLESGRTPAARLKSNIPKKSFIAKDSSSHEGDAW